MPASHPRPWHRGSLFGDGPRRPLDREQRARFRFLLTTHHRAGRLTRAARDVGEALLHRLGVDGQCDPAHATLADDADCSDRTVRRATGAMRDLGLLQWQTRLVRDGWRAAQTSNAYELVTTAALAPVVPRRRCGGQKVRESQFIEIQQPTLPLPTPSEHVAAVAALADRRRVIEARLLTRERA